jgi:hypothetical protein
MSSLTPALKQSLWNRFGDPSFPAEWDGRVYGGGKLSQRYWEYFIAIELLALDPHSVVLDLGGGSPVAGVGFLPALLAAHCRRVIVLDAHAQHPAGTAQTGNLILEKRHGDYGTVRDTLRAHPDVTHISCVSVFEHIEPLTRREIVRSINDHFAGRAFVLTLEYQARVQHWEHQLTARSLSEALGPLDRLYPDAFVRSPVYCENAYEKLGFWAPFNIRRALDRRPPLRMPTWYPVAVRFVPAL